MKQQESNRTIPDPFGDPDSPLLGPVPLAHSLELGEKLPLVRRRIGPRPWYQCLEGTPQPGRAD